MSSLFNYAKALAAKAGITFVSGEVFAKVLTQNDDSGRHGVLIPTDAYSYFPEFPIPDPKQNSTLEFPAFNTIAKVSVTLAYKYYKRYPERRITRLDGLLNDTSTTHRLLVVLRAQQKDGSSVYYFDCANSAAGGRFAELFELIFGTEIQPVPGTFVVRPVESDVFSADAALNELLAKFDAVKAQGWIDSMREGDTGIGYTFETLLGIKENNDQLADFKGIEIKCKGVKETGGGGSSKIVLFQAGPQWTVKASNKELIRQIGKLGATGLYNCKSQVTVTPNNLGLLLDVLSEESRIDLCKHADAFGHWSFARLEKRLMEKHSRTAFVKASKRPTKTRTQYRYEELVYCDRPSIERFVSLVTHRNIVFEFIMSEKPDGTVRNHGYPWRLIRAEFLDQLFSFQIKLR